MSNLPSYATGIPKTSGGNTPSYASNAVKVSSAPSYASNAVQSSGTPSYASNAVSSGAPTYGVTTPTAYNAPGAFQPTYGGANAPSYGSGSGHHFDSIPSTSYGSGGSGYGSSGTPSTHQQPPSHSQQTVGMQSQHFSQPPPQSSFQQPPPSSPVKTSAQHFSAPPSTDSPSKKKKKEETLPSSGGGLFSKLALKANQMGGAAGGVAKQKLSNISRKMKAETDLLPPPGGYVATQWEELVSATKFTRQEEIEFLYYEFKRHIFIPPKKMASSTFTPMMNFEEFENMMPPCFTNKEHYKLTLQSLFTVFKWGTQSVTFGTWVKAMSIICRGNPGEKLPLLYDVFMDPVQRTVSQNSLRFVLGEFMKLGLACASVGNAVPTQNDIEIIVKGIFYDNVQILMLDQFTQRVMSHVSHPQHPPSWKMLMDGFGVFPYIYFNFCYHVEQILAKSEQLLTVRPHKEGFLIKHSKGTFGEAWARHWSVIDGGFMYYYPANNDYDEFSRVFCLGDAEILVSKDPNDPPYCFVIKVHGFMRKFCAEDEDTFEHWLHIISISKTQSRFPNHSFSPVREGMKGRWFVDGEDTYRLMEETIMNARHEIFITDWFFSPQVYLRRYDANGNRSMQEHDRLDHLLKKKADEGVLIYVLPWSETKIAIDLGSANVKFVLERLSPNIKVLCHPLMHPIKWSHHQKTVIVDQKIAFVGGLDLCFGRWDSQRHSLTDLEQPYTFPGKDYYNPAVTEFSNVPAYEEEIVNRFEEPRMPWHDIHMMCEGEAARDVAANFIQRWNHHRDQLQQHKHIIPCSSYLPPQGKLAIQVVRSVCEWSAGVLTPEKSIENAYLAEIEEAKHFIYIENQFFISSLAGSIVENKIAVALLNKVFEAIEQNRVFRIIIIVPVHPEGNYKTTPTVRYIMGWQFKTVCRGGNSMVEQFYQRYPNLDITQYFHFYVVKKWDRIGEKLVHEQIYVHAKLMIVDDRTVIVGSANINDRSMLGDRDSEIAVVVKDREMVSSYMNGQQWQVAKFAHELRCNLYLEHLGMQQHEIQAVKDPSHPNIYTRWVQTAKQNAHILNSIFYKERTIPYEDKHYQMLLQVKGHICEYDQDLLSDTEMAKTQSADVLIASDDIFT